MIKLKPDLLDEINQYVKPNGNAEITGGLLQGVMHTMTDTLLGSYYAFPKSENLHQSHVGKLVGNNGSGLADVYQLAPAVTTPQLGRWVIKLEDINVGQLNNFSTIRIQIGDDDEYDINRLTWRGPGPPPPPGNAILEMERIRNYINSSTDWDNLEADIVVDELIIIETSLGPTIITMFDFPNFSYFTDTASLAPQPATSAAFPLGKLVGVDEDRGLAFISANKIEEYTLATGLTINHSFFNTRSDIDFENVDHLSAFTRMLIVPSNNGLVEPLDLTDPDFSNSFRGLDKHFLGIAISVTNDKVVVMHMNEISLILQFIRGLIVKGVIPTGDDPY